jgi:hypothetical protein
MAHSNCARSVRSRFARKLLRCRFCGEWLEPTEPDSARKLTTAKPVPPPPTPPQEGTEQNSMMAVGRALDETDRQQRPKNPPAPDIQNKPPPKVSAKTPGGASLDGFKNPRSLANWLTVLLILMALFYGIAIWGGVLKLDLLSRAISGGQFSTAWARTVVYSSSPIADLLFIPTGIFFLRWVYVAAKNARTIGMRNPRLFEHSFELAFTPGWSVGFYFVPLFNLWKPYQAMKWIWRASGSPDARDNKSKILPLWWTFWLLSNLISIMAFKAGQTAQNPSDYTTAVAEYVISDAAQILSCVFALLLVRRLSRRQLRALPNAA